MPLFFFFKCFQKLFAADGIGTELGDYDTGSEICKVSTGHRCDTTGDTHGEDGDDGIPCAGDIEYLLCLGRDMLDLSSQIRERPASERVTMMLPRWNLFITSRAACSTGASSLRMGSGRTALISLRFGVM